MDNRRLKKISKYLSKHLRHQPGRLGIALAPGGWVEIDRLLRACRRHNFPITRAELEEVVARNDKQRFAIDEKTEMIRANQGHSIDVDLALAPCVPPPVLYHGTGEKRVSAIREKGLNRMGRHHVHLCRDAETAEKVGARRGRPVVFRIDAAGMDRDGYTFFVSENDVWLVDHVPPEYLEEPK